ncbi:MAG: single-stranded-DNA-specific exonuclease RecJ [candidate division KSB1 bacterium]|nr:single-stranded-DNA-specific exonuclease RecJ [candidate division KSB1 bacterium]
MNQKWLLLDEYSAERVESFAKQLNVPRIIAKILLNRGISDYDNAKNFFRPNLDLLHDPFLMKDMEEAVSRVCRALKNREKILIYGDYDVDGITAVSMLYLVFRDLGHEVSFYIPDRLREGYGLSPVGIHEAHKRGVKLIISVDCGVTALEEIELARQYGIDVIVCDHHEPGTQLPQAAAILDPKRADCGYPFKELAGVGVAYKLAQALFEALSIDRSILQRYVDLVAIGSAADIVPLVEENRIFVKAGLESLNESDKLGLQALLEACGLKNKEINTGQVVFIIAPRINAVGRMGDAERAVRLLTTQNVQQAKNIAAILEAENRHRKNVDEETYKQALEMIEQNCDLEKDKVIVLDLEGWHPGVIGIVASRIVEKYYRPTIMISTDEGIGKGSARSIPGFDLYLALKECKELMLGFGGHKYAAGLTIRQEKIHPFRERFREIADRWLTEEHLTPKLRIDGEIRLGHIDGKLLRILKLFAPFGPQNMRPVFMSRNLEVVGTPMVVGNNHLRFKVRQDGVVIDAIGFNLGDLLYRIAPGEPNLDMAYVIEENEWQGRTTIQLRVKDLR